MNSIVSKIDNRKKNSLKDSIVSYENIYNNTALNQYLIVCKSITYIKKCL